MTDEELSFDHLGYASCYGMWIGKRKCAGFPTEYWVCYGPHHPHDPDFDCEIVAGPHPTSEAEAVALARSTAIRSLEQTLETLKAGGGV